MGCKSSTDKKDEKKELAAFPQLVASLQESIIALTQGQHQEEAAQIYTESLLHLLTLHCVCFRGTVDAPDWLQMVQAYSPPNTLYRIAMNRAQAIMDSITGKGASPAAAAEGSVVVTQQLLQAHMDSLGQVAQRLSSAASGNNNNATARRMAALYFQLAALWPQASTTQCAALQELIDVKILAPLAGCLKVDEEERRISAEEGDKGPLLLNDVDARFQLLAFSSITSSIDLYIWAEWNDVRLSGQDAPRLARVVEQAQQTPSDVLARLLRSLDTSMTAFGDSVGELLIAHIVMCRLLLPEKAENWFFAKKHIADPTSFFAPPGSVWRRAIECACRLPKLEQPSSTIDMTPLLRAVEYFVRSQEGRHCTPSNSQHYLQLLFYVVIHWMLLLPKTNIVSSQAAKAFHARLTRHQRFGFSRAAWNSAWMACTSKEILSLKEIRGQTGEPQKTTLLLFQLQGCPTENSSKDDADAAWNDIRICSPRGQPLQNAFHWNDKAARELKKIENRQYLEKNMAEIRRFVYCGSNVPIDETLDEKLRGAVGMDVRTKPHLTVGADDLPRDPIEWLLSRVSGDERKEGTRQGVVPVSGNKDGPSTPPAINPHDADERNNLDMTRPGSPLLDGVRAGSPMYRLAFATKLPLTGKYLQSVRSPESPQEFVSVTDGYLYGLEIFELLAGYPLFASPTAQRNGESTMSCFLKERYSELSWVSQVLLAHALDEDPKQRWTCEKVRRWWENVPSTDLAKDPLIEALGQRGDIPVEGSGEGSPTNKSASASASPTHQSTRGQANPPNNTSCNPSNGGAANGSASAVHQNGDGILCEAKANSRRCRVKVFCGPAGCGKTHTARQIVDANPENVTLACMAELLESYEQSMTMAIDAAAANAMPVTRIADVFQGSIVRGQRNLQATELLLIDSVDVLEEFGETILNAVESLLGNFLNQSDHNTIYLYRRTAYDVPQRLTPFVSLERRYPILPEMVGTLEDARRSVPEPLHEVLFDGSSGLALYMRSWETRRAILHWINTTASWTTVPRLNMFCCVLQKMVDHELRWLTRLPLSFPRAAWDNELLRYRYAWTPGSTRLQEISEHLCMHTSANWFEYHHITQQSHLTEILRRRIFAHYGFGQHNVLELTARLWGTDSLCRPRLPLPPVDLKEAWLRSCPFENLSTTVRLPNGVSHGPIPTATATRYYKFVPRAARTEQATHVYRFLMLHQPHDPILSEHIVRVHEMTETSAGHGICMERLQEVDVEKLGGLHERLRLLLQVGEGLTLLHQRGIFHCDIKLVNVMRRRKEDREDEWIYVIIDFDACLVDIRGDVACRFRTEKYATPEQLRGYNNVSTDCGLFCCLALHVLSGHDPADQPWPDHLEVALPDGLFVFLRDAWRNVARPHLSEVIHRLTEAL